MPITALDARYPFFETARTAVQETDVALPTLIAEDAPAVERGRERVERALMEGTTAPEDPHAWQPRDELLSYPIARILVSLIDAPAAVEKYAEAEAATAYDRFTDDFETGDDGLRSTPSERVTLDRFLREFDLADDVRPETASGRGSRTQAGGEDRYWIAVGSYLRLTDDRGERWRLVNRELADGEVRVTQDELYRLLRVAVRRRVADGLPFDVTASSGGPDLAAELESEVAHLRDLLAERDSVGDIDTVVPDLFPPCMTDLLERAQRGADLSPQGSFALLAFLTGIGMDLEETLAFCRDTSLDPEAIRYQTEYLRDDGGTQYPPPSCETLHEYGLCDNEDDHWDVSSHPLVYYKKTLAAADDEELAEWQASADPSEA